MEFKAKRIKIAHSDPYKEDKLSRKGHIDNLSLLLRNFSTPIVLSINAPWGRGKTTFIGNGVTLSNLVSRIEMVERFEFTTN